MNPNLNWSDIYPGQPSGGIGGVVHVDRLKLGLDAIRLIEAGDTEMKVWTKQDRAAMRRWVTKFLDWWLNSELGQQARYNPDNIGISYQLNAMAMAFYLNNMSLAHDVALADSRFRYDNEIDTKGRVYRELGDSGSFAYTVGTMSSFMLLARASKIAGLDLYTCKTSIPFRFDRARRLANVATAHRRLQQQHGIWRPAALSRVDGTVLRQGRDLREREQLQDAAGAGQVHRLAVPRSGLLAAERVQDNLRPGSAGVSEPDLR